ncbi:DUF7948 domain-containing protein [Aurantibacillus circumpalustris]|uniref:DUF7948 domain-containing protein n=1 Tax=Aurantibacillus circumpalustris TaxID=3036359 RepID=UPI00295B7C95|nr:SBBP repeat-containing protein [Aurantibacillus circumpalustris]
MKKFTIFFYLMFLASFSVWSTTTPEINNPSKQLSFQENKGQVSDQNSRPRPDILFSGRTAGMNFYLAKNGISYQLQRVDSWKKCKSPLQRFNPSSSELKVPAQTTVYRLDIAWVNCSNPVQIEKKEALSGYNNYYLASCPDGALNVKSYTNLLYKEIYPGIDLKWYENSGNLKYDYYVSANSNYKNIQLEYKGADKIYVNDKGQLIVETPLGIIKEEKPLVLQNNKKLNATWLVKGNTVSFNIKNVDSSLPLIIDPMVRLWGTYYGGTGDDQTFHVTNDAAGNVFMSGWTTSSGNMATTGAHQNIFSGGSNTYDAFLVKFNSTAVRQWATYYGGTGVDYGYEVNCDASGNVFVVGETTSSTTGVIATAGAHQVVYGSSSAPANQGDGFLVMFNSSGIRQWGTYYGGEKPDAVNGLSLDNSGNIYIIGSSQSTLGIATPGSHQALLSTAEDGFIAKFNSQGVRQWGTYYAGNATGKDCANNASGDVYVCGVTTSSTGIATAGCHQAVFGGGSDAYYAKFNSLGVLQWGTYYGGSALDAAHTIAVDASGNVYSGGYCASSTGTVFATIGSHQPTYGGGAYDGYVVKFDQAGVRLWGTYYGGAGYEGIGVKPDASGNVYVYGSTNTSTGTAVATSCSYQDQYAGGSSDLFVVKFTAAGSRVWGTYFGSMYSDDGVGLSIDANNDIYLCGITLANSGTVIASNGAHQAIYGGGAADAVLIKLTDCNPGPPIDLTPPSGHLVCVGDTAKLSTTCGNWYSSLAGTTILSTGSSFTVGPLFADTTLYVEDFGCGVVSSIRTAITVTVVTPIITLTNSNPQACVGENITLTASGASTYSWTSPFTNSVSTSIQAYVFLNTTYTVTGQDANGCRSTATIAVAPNLCDGLGENGFYDKPIVIYPNPNNGSFTLQSASSIELSVTNEMGQIIRTVSLSPSTNFRGIIDELPNGVYFLSGDTENKIATKKIVVIR